MHFSTSPGFRTAQWAAVGALPLVAWVLSSLDFPGHLPFGVFFVAAAVICAAAGGLMPAWAATMANIVGLWLFFYLHPAAGTPVTIGLWSALLGSVALLVGYAREKSSAAQTIAGRLRSDLARLRDELDTQRSDLKRFQELSVSLSSSLELQRLLHHVLAAIAALQKTDLAMLLLLSDSSGHTLRVETYAGFTADQIRLFGKFPTSFFSTGRRFAIEDVELPGTHFPFRDAARQLGFRAVFSTPIINSRGEPLGVVATFFKRPYTPPDRQVRMVELYARQAANALDNARLYRDSLDTLAAERQRSAVLNSLADASVQINSTLALDSLLRIVTEQARRIIGARQAFATLLPDAERNQSITCTSVEEGQKPLPFPPERSEMFMLACGLNKPIRIPSGAQASHGWHAMAKSSDAVRDGWLAAPLLTRDGRNLGLIQVSQKIHGEFLEDDEAILVHVAHMASVAIDNVRLYREAQEQIAETRRAQEALQRSKESIQLAQKCVGIGMWEWDLQSGKLAWSDEICRMHGVEAPEFAGTYESWMERIHPEDSWHVHASITEALAKQSDYEAQYRVEFPDRSLHWLELRGQTIVIGNTPVRMLGVAMDVTSRKGVEEALRRSEKVAATGQLAASIAHEINNPLSAVTNVLYILRTHPQMPGQLLDLMQMGERELERVIHITRQTLAFYREVPRPVMTSIPQLLEEVLAAYSHKIDERNVAIEKRLRDVEDIPAFPGELRQVLSNLLLNALEAVPDSGRIYLRVRQATGRNEQSGIRITVADNGGGIARQHLSRVFEPFFTTKESKGTGLGLWVSQGIVQKHGGLIRLRSQIEGHHRGTCFAVFIPSNAAGMSVHEGSANSAKRSAAGSEFDTTAA
jgi:PAS domain S-box-containing protein